jgi:hypothetical protein
MSRLTYIAIALACAGLVASCTKKQDYGGTAVQKMANGWWVKAYSSVNGLVSVTPPANPAGSDSAAGHIFFVTYNTSADTKDSLWVDDLGNIGAFGPAGYDVKSTLGVNDANYTLTSSGTANLYQIGNPVRYANGMIFPKGGRSRSGVATDSIFLQIVFTAGATDTLTIEGVARTGFDQDDWPASPYGQ